MFKKRLLLVLFLILGICSLTLVGCKRNNPEPEHNHDELAWVEEVKATESKDGMAGHYFCEVCGKYFDANKQEVTRESLVLKYQAPQPTCDHDNLTWVAEVAATETADGLAGHYYCEVCGKYFDANKQEVTRESLVLKYQAPQTVNHQSAFVTELAAGAQTRAFNELFDELVSDFSAASAATVNNHLRVLVDDQLTVKPNTPDASIYKMATGVYEIQSFDGIGFRIRTVGEGTLSLANLVLALRGDDAYDVYEINLADALDPDGEALNELTSEYQDLIICPNLSIDDDATEYQLAGNAGASGTKVLDKILGFHLYLTGECSQVIEIEKVFLVKGADETLLDSFNREKVNKADNTCWWRDSTGFIVQQGVAILGNDKYTADLTATTGANLVLNIMGDTTGTTVGGVTWANLKDANGNAVANAVNGAFHSLVINLEASGITSKSVEIASTTEVVISKVFVTDLQDKAPVTEYPVIDTINIAMFDNFNRTQSGFDGDYDASSTNPIVTGAGLFYALSYHNGDKVSVANGHVTFDATTEVDYINFKEGRTVYEGQKYLVLIVKLENGATLDNFRFDIGSGVTYVNQMYSAFGLKVPLTASDAYPYVDENGYTWLIIDLAESKMTPNATDGFIDFYYSGTGKLLIDAAFYCDEKGANPTYYEEEIGTVASTNLGAYAYGGAFNPEGAKYVKIVFTCADDSTLKTIRIEGAEGAKWFKDGDLIDMEGNPIDGDTPLKDLTIIIDLEASGLNVDDFNHVHTGDFDGTVTEGAFSATIIALTEESEEELYSEEEIAEVASTNLGAYAYGGAFNPEGATLVKIVFDCEDDSTLKTIRIEGANGAKWFKDGDIKDEEGNAIDGDTPLKDLVIVIDLVASGLNVDDFNHVHTGDFDGSVTEGAFSATIYALTLDEENPFQEEEIAEVASTNLGAYAYGGAFNPDGATLVKIVFDCEDDSTLKTIRIEGADGAKWFKDGDIKDEEGNAIDGDTPLKDLTIVIDLVASGLNVNDFNHVHTGDFDGSVTEGAFSATIYGLYIVEGPTYEETQISAVSVTNLGAYAYGGAFNPEGVNLVEIEFNCEDDSTLKTIRIEGANGVKWFKDGDIKDEEGNAIDGDTPLKDLVIVIDMTASGLTLDDFNHIHTGDFDGSVTEGAFTASVYSLAPIGEYSEYQAAMELFLQ